MSNNNSINIDSISNRISSNDFPYNFNDGTAHLLSNQKLIRFCPTVAFNNIVKCKLTHFLYTNSYTKGYSYGFDYPHCPCDDSSTGCHLYLSEKLSEFNFDSKQLSFTTLHIDKNTKITNAKIIKTVMMSDDVVLNLYGDFTLSKLSFSVGDVVVYQFTNTQSTFQYNSTNHQLLCTNNISSYITVNREIDNIIINCSGIINTIELSGDKLVYITKEVKQVDEIIFTIYDNEKPKTFTFVLESENTVFGTPIYNNCMIITLIPNENKCLKCNSKTRL
ncbi:hypothetical protein EIN_288520 [Entamoeba invadens IP1]|uniref:Uncharacterized protein n=1 Tax=Entamoeba invadens IP1 TaxID=370355 RepID=A0A0A1U8G8_ENTIV|nr:hypothetical protein EIN_288520 [Entamoeba invadens IP1]ELP89356.1 hypothetical protein EIN_288520 [Entamoeba invadens IP1]|eukprot:XP_004256127.1 hypothetical protein EIN_288520 [Entamoeba invadens IP1]